MIQVPYDEPTDPDWREWRCKTLKECTLLLQNFRFGKKPNINENRYREMRDFLMDRFHNKCAYCETEILRNPEEVEHYRPKAGVTDLEGKVVMIKDLDGAEHEHPGYYWLAYDWKNLLPSCKFCNRRRYHGQDKALWGKGTCFPVEQNAYAWSPDGNAINAEYPLLIHPRLHDPEEHLEFIKTEDSKGEDLCLIKAKDLRGETTIKLLGLILDERLRKPRVRAYWNGFSAVSEVWDGVRSLKGTSQAQRILLRPILEQKKQALRRLWAGEEPYTAFARLGNKDNLQELSSLTEIPVDQLMNWVRAEEPAISAIPPPAAEYV